MMSFKHVRALIAFLMVIFLTTGTASALSALHKAALKGDLKKINELLDKGADVNEWKMGTPLMFATSGGKLEASKLLVERGADLNRSGQNGWTALGLAAYGSFPDIVDYLIVKGADIDGAIEGLKTMAEWLGNQAKVNDQVAGGIRLIKDRAGMAFYRAGKYEKAVSFFQALIQADPKNAQNYLGLAFCLNALGKNEEARAAAETAVKLAPENSDAHVALADSLSGKKDYAAAVESLKKAAAITPGNPWIYNRMGNAYYLLVDYPSAVENFKKASELAPGVQAPLRSLMNINSRMANYDEAITYAGKLLDIKELDDRAAVLGLRCILYREKGAADAAAADAEKAVSIDAGNDWSLLALGVIALDRGNYDEAVARLSAIKDRDFTLALILEAIARARKGDAAEAERTFIAAGKDVFSSSNSLVANNVRILAELLKPTVQAHLDKAAALGFGPGAAEALAEYGRAMAVSGPSLSTDITSRAAALLKARPELKELTEEARKYFLRADVLLKEKDYEGALKEYSSALGISPFCPILHYNAALISADAGRTALAVEHMKTFLGLDPDSKAARDAQDLIYKWEFMIERNSGRK